MPKCDGRVVKGKPVAGAGRAGPAARARLLPLAIGLLGAAAGAAGAQASPDSAAPAALVLDVGSETENQLRYLQTLGMVPPSQWTLRGFGPREIASLAASGSLAPGRPGGRTVHGAGRARWQVIPLAGDLWYNTGFAFGNNDGAVWRGRGATVALRGGIAARYGPLSLQLAPLAFLAENRGFELMPLVGAGPSVYADPLRPTTIDRPQRFGDRRYGAIDPGQSTLRLDALGATVGVSTANQWWGPMSEWPYLLSNNAAGFPHLFAGTSRPASVGIGRAHGRVIYGRLDQSAFTGITGAARNQFITGLLLSFQPRGIDGLEVGAARLFEIAWPEGGIGSRELRKPLEAFLKENIAGDPDLTNNSGRDNQLASAFARWSFPGSGFELYGELGRNDHNVDTRDLALEPDHSMTIGLGLRKAWRGAEGSVRGLEMEVFDGDPSTFERFRGQGRLYTHTRARQGHTNRGQVLGAGFAAEKAAGSRVQWDRFDSQGRQLTLSLDRLVVREQLTPAFAGDAVDVQYVVAVDRATRWNGVGFRYGALVVRELNRYLQGDATNIQTSLGVTW